jgi:membrane protease subunit HflK
MNDANQPDSVDNQKNQFETDKSRFKALSRASCLAIGVDLFLILLKYLLAIMTGSPVLVADALHSGGDLAVSLVVFLSIAAHYWFKDNKWVKKVEGVVALLISFALITGSCQVALRVLRNESAKFILSRGIPLIIAISGISIALLITFAMSRFKRRVGETYASIAFIAEGMHTRSDFLTSFGVWLTLCLGYFGVHIERVMTLLVSLAVLRIGIELLFQALQFLTFIQILRSDVKMLMPLCIRERAHNLRQTVSQFWCTITSLIPQILFVWEDWVFKQRTLLIIGNILLVGLLYIGTGFYTVLPYETGLELLFGKVVEQNPPGWHFHVPKPFGKVVRVDTEVIARVESGFRTRWDFRGKEPEAYLWEYTHVEGRYFRVPEEAIAITGDENLVDVNFVCYYRIINPVQYVFNAENAHEVLRSLFCHEIHAELGRYRLDSLLTSDRGKIQTELLQNMKCVVKNLPLGVKILNVYMREAHPPIEVVSNYRAVASAREKKVEIIHTANTYANEVLPLSRGQAEVEILQANADAAEKIYAAAGSAENFLLKQQTFRQSEAVQRVRLWWKTVENVMKDKIIYILPKNAKRRIYNSQMTPIKEIQGEDNIRFKELEELDR